jgi:hypothetical protein
MLRVANAHEPRHENMPKRHIPCLCSHASYDVIPKIQQENTALLCARYGVDITPDGPVAGLVGIEVGVVSVVINLESPALSQLEWPH